MRIKLGELWWVWGGERGAREQYKVWGLVVGAEI